MRDHRQLRAFQLADQLTLAVYETTRNFPSSEQFGLVHQMRRASVSVPANIVEGCGRSTPHDYVRFLDIAMGSLRELGYLLSLAQRLGYVQLDSAQPLQDAHDEAARTLGGLIQANRRELS